MPEENKPKKKWYKRWWAFVLYFFIFIIIVSSISDDDAQTNKPGGQVINDHLSVRTESNGNANQVQEAPNQPSSAENTEAGVNQQQHIKTEPIEQKKEESKPQEKSYQQIFTFSGNGAKKSEPFIVTGSRFKIKYNCTGDLCQAFLHGTKNEYDMELIMNTTEPVSDETIIYGSGEYYIEANTIVSYTMIVEDYI